MRVAADETLTLDLIAGTIAVGGGAGVGASAAVPVVTKTTTAYIGSGATVTGRGFGSGLTVKQGVYTVTTLDTRFNGNSVEGDGHTINMGFAHGFSEGEQVTYDNGGGTRDRRPQRRQRPDAGRLLRPRRLADRGPAVADEGRPGARARRTAPASRTASSRR